MYCIWERGSNYLYIAFSIVCTCMYSYEQQYTHLPGQEGGLLIMIRVNTCVRGQFTCHNYEIWYTVEPLYNGQVGAGASVCYLEVSFIGRFHHSMGVAYHQNR